jgi:hypothetical protein
VVFILVDAARGCWSSSSAPFSAENACSIYTAVSLSHQDRDAFLTGEIADRVATLSDLRGLTDVLAMLVPRTQVA